MMKKTLLFLFIILLVLSIGAVSATNENCTSNSDVTNTDNVISENTENNDTSILSNENAQKSMTELENTIKTNKNTTIFLNDDYQWTEQDTDLENGIIVNKSLIIDGQGHKIDANHKMRIFQITNNAMITFKNITFLNGSTAKNGYGGAVWNTGDKNIIIINCTFNGNTADYGGAISGHIGDIANCTFTGNTAEFGGAIYINSGGVSGNLGGTYINNTAKENGGAIYIDGGVSGNLTGTYINNTAKEYDGGAIAIIGGVSGNLTGTFINNIGNYSGGSIYISGDVSGNLASTFINNTAILDGGAINIDGDVSGNLGGIFINNTATDSNGGAINIDGDVSGNLTGTFINNIGNYSGGSIYISGDVSGNLASTFINNTAKEYDGGAIAIIGGVSGNLAGTFINNTAKEYGGAIFIYYTGLNIIHECVFINNTIDVKSGNITLINCWFGNNATNYNKKPTNVGNVNIDNWLFLNATANATKLNVGETSTITFKLDTYNDTSKKISSYKTPMNLILDLTQTLGELNKNNSSIGENISYTARETGNACVTGKFENTYYTFNIENQNMSDSRKNLTINATTDSITVGEDATINITGLEDATGNVTVTINNKNYTTTITNGKSTITVSNLSVGNFIANVTYVGDDNYNPSSTTVNITVTKSDPHVSANNTLFIVGNEGILNISGPSDHWGYLNVTINHKFVYNTIIKNGFAYLDVSNLDVGFYTVDILYTENAKYLEKEFDNIATVTVTDKEDTPLNINNLTINVDDVANINVTGIPKALNGRNITITITGKASKNAIINNGTASSSFTGIIARNYVISAHYDGDNVYKANTTNATLTVNKCVPNVTAMNTLFIIGNEGTLNISGPFDRDGYLIINIGDEKYVATLNGGIASVNISNLNVGQYDVTITYQENDKYLEKELDNIATVEVDDKYPTPLNINNLTINVDDVANINVTGIPKALNGRNITITITGKASKNAIINNGTASSSFTGIIARNYVISAHYDGDNVYKANTTNATLTVNKCVPNVTAMNTSFIIGNEGTLNISGPFDRDGYLIINIGDEKYVATLNGGIASVNISNLNVGQYDVTITYQENDKYLEKEFDNIATVEVDDKYPTPLNINNLTINVDDVANINVTGIPKALNGRNITITITGKASKTTIINNGTASSSFTGIIARNYIISAHYDGDNVYKANTTNATLTVNKIVPNVTAMNTSFIIGNEGTLNISGPFDRDGYLIINIGDKKYVATLNGGIASVNISNLNVGQYNVTITYQENDKYLEKEFDNIATVEVDDKYPTPLNINNLTINVDDVANINVTGIPKALNGRNITITITGKASKNAIINNGTATATFKNLTKSNYEIVAEYTGDNIYKANTTNATLTINKFIPDVSAISTSFIVGNEGILNITGSSDCIGILNITIGDNKYTSILINGKATLNVSNLGIGEYGVDIIYLENDRYYERAFYNIATVTVTDKADTPLNVDDVFINVGDDAVINVVGIPEALNGNNITVKIIDKSTKNVIIDNEKASATFHGLAAGIYGIVVKYDGDSIYKSNTTKAILTVEKAKPTTSINVEDIFVSNDEIVIVTMPSDAKGIILFNVNDKNYFADIKNGESTLIISDLPVGNYTITYIYNGDEKYLNATGKSQFEVLLNDTYDIIVESTTIQVGDDANIHVLLPIDATGTVTATVDEKYYSAPVVDGIGNIIIPGLVVGNYTALISYLGNDKYASSSISANISVSKIPDVPIYAEVNPIKFGDDAIIYVELPKDTNGTVTATVNNKSYIVSLEDGKTNINISGLDSGNYTAIITYSGNDKYESVTTNVTIEVSNNFEVFAPDVVKYYHGAERFNVYVLLNGKAVANKTVKITINGITYNKTTDTKGIASFAIRLSNGTYNVTTTVDNTTVKSNVTVLSTIIGFDLTKYYKNQTQYSVKVYDTKGKPVGKNEIVTFNVNGIFYNRTTDENGIATLNINLPPSDYIITADYKGCKISNKIKVLQVLNAEDIIMNYLDGTQFKANLVDGQGKPYKNQMITFNINGISYNRLTDSNGQAALNIRLIPGEYIITSSFNGANIANKITITG